MSDKVIVEDEGDTSFIKGEIISKIRFEEENKKILAQGGKPAVGKVSILGITRAAIYTESWLSSASFEQTTNVLTNAAIKGQVDYLLGLKENVIIGRLIPVNEELIKKYYGKFLDNYADDQSTREKGTEKRLKKSRSAALKSSFNIIKRKYVQTNNPFKRGVCTVVQTMTPKNQIRL
jgi:DNA-directed RNA polymerase subunit beta'